MQPRSRPRSLNVTNAPDGRASSPSGDDTGNSLCSSTIREIDWRAISRSARFSSLRSGDILRVLLLLQNQGHAPLLEAVIHLTPEQFEVMHSRDDSADH